MIPYMLESFLDADKGFSKARKDVAELPAAPPPPKRLGRPPRQGEAPGVPEPAPDSDLTLPNT